MKDPSSLFSVAHFRLLTTPIDLLCARSGFALSPSDLIQQQENALKRADASFERVLNGFRLAVAEQLALADEGCPHHEDIEPDALHEYPVETWVGAVIRSLANDCFLLQLRDNRPGIHNPLRICNFGGTLKANERPSETFVREFHDELLGCDIFENAFLDVLRVYPVRTAWGTVIRVVFEMVIPFVPLTLRVGEGAGFISSNAESVPQLAGITPLSKEDMILSLGREPAIARYNDALPREARASFRLDRDVFGADSGEPDDQT